MCVCVCERERDKVASQRNVQCVGNCLNRSLFETHTSFITVSVTQLCSPLGLELMVKLRTLLTVFTLIFSWSSRLWKGALHFRRGLAPFSYMLFHANCLTCAIHVPEEFSLVECTVDLENPSVCVLSLCVCTVTVEDAVDPLKGMSGGGGELMVGQFSGEGPHWKALRPQTHSGMHHIYLQPCLMILQLPQQPVKGYNIHLRLSVCPQMFMLVICIIPSLLYSWYDVEWFHVIHERKTYSLVMVT